MNALVLAIVVGAVPLWIIALILGAAMQGISKSAYAINQATLGLGYAVTWLLGRGSKKCVAVIDERLVNDQALHPPSQTEVDDSGLQRKPRRRWRTDAETSWTPSLDPEADALRVYQPQPTTTDCPPQVTYRSRSEPLFARSAANGKAILLDETASLLKSIDEEKLPYAWILPANKK